MNIEQEARDLLNAAWGSTVFALGDPVDHPTMKAVCRALEARNEVQAAFDAYRREVAEAIAYCVGQGMSKIGWQIGPIETPASVDLMQEAREVVARRADGKGGHEFARRVRHGDLDDTLTVQHTLAGIKRGMELTPAKPAHAPSLTDEQDLENCARLVDAWGFVEAGTAIRNRVRWGDNDRAFIAEYRRQTSALTMPVLTEDMVRRAWDRERDRPSDWDCAAIAESLNTELARGRS